MNLSNRERLARAAISRLRDWFFVGLLQFPQTAGKILIIDEQGRLEVEPEAAHVEIDRTQKGKIAIDGNGLRMEKAAGKEEERNPSAEEFLKAGPTGIGDQQRIIFGGDDDADIDATLGRGLQGGEQRLVRDEVGGGQDQFPAGRINGGQEQAVDGFLRQSRA